MFTFSFASLVDKTRSIPSGKMQCLSANFTPATLFLIPEYGTGRAILPHRHKDLLGTDSGCMLDGGSKRPEWRLQME